MKRRFVICLYTFWLPLSFLLFAARVSADETLRNSLEDFVADIQAVIEETEPVFLDDVFQQWARLTLGVESMTYIVDTRDPDRTLGVVTFMCKITQSDFFETKEEAEAAPIKNMVPRLIPCRVTYEWKAGSWKYVDGATYVRRGDWEPIPTDKPNAFPQLYFDLMKRAPASPSRRSLKQPGQSEKPAPQSRSQAAPLQYEEQYNPPKARRLA